MFGYSREEAIGKPINVKIREKQNSMPNSITQISLKSTTLARKMDIFI